MKVSVAVIITAQLFTVFFILPGTSSDDCGTGAEWKTCGLAPACVQNCGNRNIGLLCTADCHQGCYCITGYIRESANGDCILESDCPA